MVSLTVWCGQEPPPRDLVNVVLWESFLPDDAPESWIALPSEIHARRDVLREQYLQWVHDLGVRQVRGKSFRERVMIRPNLSYWWMTVPACYSLDPNSPVYNAVRLEELHRIATQWHAESAKLLNASKATARLINSWARDTGRTFTAESPEPRLHGSHLGRIKTALLAAMPPLGAVSTLLAIGKQPGFAPHAAPPDSEPGIVMIDYLAHLGKDESGSGRFTSNYWGPLVDLVEEQGDTTWLHLSADRPTTAGLTSDKATINSWSVPEHVRHHLLHAGASRRIKWSAVRDYVRVAVMGLRTRKKRKLFFDSQAQASQWPALEATYRDEWYGATAMLNCLYLNLLEDYFTKQPRARLGIYLFENQPWEMALIHAWKKAGHGRIIGFAHSTVLFWNTRIFKDPRDLWESGSPAAMVWPDAVAVNGPVVRAGMQDGGFSTALLADVEAVRYTDAASQRERSNTGHMTLLVFGEYSWDATERILAITTSAVGQTGFEGRVVFRSHPACTPDLSKVPAWVHLDESPTGAHAIDNADIVISGALTTAAVEARLKGRPTFLIADGRLFLCSPAEPLGPLWIMRGGELGQVLLRWSSDGRFAATAQDALFFLQDDDLSRWKSILDNSQ